MITSWSCVPRVAAVLVVASTVGAAGLDPASVHAAAAFPVKAASDPVLEVEVDPQMLQGQAHRGWVEARAREVLERRPGALEAGDRIVVALAGTSYDYRVAIRVSRGGEPLASQPEPFVCNGSSDELLGQVEAAVDEAVDRLIDARRAEREQVERERAEREQAEHEQAERRRLAARPYRPERLGVAGAVAMGLGGAVVVAGGIAMAYDVVPATNDLLEPLDFKPPGYALLGAGSVVVATGLGLLVADVVRCKKDRVKCGQREPLLQRAARASRGVVLRW